MKHVPNTITVVRIFFAPVFIWLLLAAGPDLASPARWWGAILFIVGLGTDGIDGYLARKFNVVSEFGKLMDPIADKVLTLGALITLSILNELPWWVTILIAVREIGITVYRFFMLSDHVIAASPAGKLKTIMQFVAISFALLPLAPLVGDWYNGFNVVTMTIATVLTLWSGFEYVRDGIRAQRSGSSANGKA
jgi:CDP-diacylglycerol--glycerol-3-phosphate 3-phosphatidyltransferase